MLFRSRRLHIARIRLAAICGAVGSWAALLWVGAASDGSNLSASHLYFGTDTHSSGLFIGAALAVSWVPKNLHSQVSRSGLVLINGVGIWGLALLMWVFINVSETTGAYYTAGFPLAGIGTAALIASVVHPSSWLRRPLTTGIMQWIGTRSYGIYLWHWVIIQVLRPGLDIPLSGTDLVLVQLVLIAAISEFSYRVIEMPIRRVQLLRWLRSLTLLPGNKIGRAHV